MFNCGRSHWKCSKKDTKKLEGKRVEKFSQGKSKGIRNHLKNRGIPIICVKKIEVELYCYSNSIIFPGQSSVSAFFGIFKISHGCQTACFYVDIY